MVHKTKDNVFFLKIKKNKGYILDKIMYKITFP